ncbi:MAG: hypothetical protein JNL33_17540 [Betaproteobacteria bacterium]|nr:hypothetical protein [Betaproteobacteria bacterium]
MRVVVGVLEQECDAEEQDDDTDPDDGVAAGEPPENALDELSGRRRAAGPGTGQRLGFRGDCRHRLAGFPGRAVGRDRRRRDDGRFVDCRVHRRARLHLAGIDVSRSGSFRGCRTGFQVPQPGAQQLDGGALFPDLILERLQARGGCDGNGILAAQQESDDGAADGADDGTPFVTDAAAQGGSEQKSDEPHGRGFYARCRPRRSLLIQQQSDFRHQDYIVRSHHGRLFPAIRKQEQSVVKGTEGAGQAPWEGEDVEALIGELFALKNGLLEAQGDQRDAVAEVHPEHVAGATNLVHYVALRQRDVRSLQDRLARMGLSSLGRAESHVMANLDKVLGLLHRLCGRPWSVMSADEPAGYNSARRLLAAHADALLGAAPPACPVRIMVTMPAEAAEDYGLVRDMVLAGMTCARINCAHDGEPVWQAIADNVKRAAAESGRSCRIHMDLGGPKLRTGPVEPGPAVLKWKPGRDALGRVIRPARIGLHPFGESPGAAVPADAHLGVDGDWLAQLVTGDAVEFVDARGAHRRLDIVDVQTWGCMAESSRTAYVVPETRLTLSSERLVHGRRTSGVGDIPPGPAVLKLHNGERIVLGNGGLTGRPAAPGPEGATRPATIGCTLPEALRRIHVGQRVYFDDGRIRGVVRGVSHGKAEVEITRAREEGDRLAPDKGINLPDTDIDVPALTDKDRADLAFAVTVADSIGLSFVRSPVDVILLQEALRMLGAEHLGIVLKIENRAAFGQLPELLLTAMRSRCAGLMIARGDLAVEIGYERLAEVQEEILWIAEAAHLPVIWATQVLEGLAKTGQPSRAEITDAAMGERAECVMLNKGPHIVEAIETLVSIVSRMAGHQHKKQSWLRRLRSWDLEDADLPAPTR